MYCIRQWRREGIKRSTIFFFFLENQETKYPTRQRAARRKFCAQWRERRKGGEKECERKISSNGFKHAVLRPVMPVFGNMRNTSSRAALSPAESEILLLALDINVLTSSPDDSGVYSSLRTTNVFTSEFLPHLLIIYLKAFRHTDEVFIEVVCM